jgi:tripartite-type tricarboxylate transporter receptor subunit TctC
MRGKAVTTFCSGLLVFFFVCLIGGAGAQVESFYRGKTITIVVGYNPGDAHDLWARAYSRYMGRYIPGNPNVIVRNMPGGGTMIAANYVMVLPSRMEPLWDQYFRRYILRSSRDGRK